MENILRCLNQCFDSFLEFFLESFLEKSRNILENPGKFQEDPGNSRKKIFLK
jgi:hypothetical protein